MILFDATYPKLDQLIEIPNRAQDHRLLLREDHLLSYAPGESDFGLVMSHKTFDNFKATLVVLAPPGDYDFANSGLFFGFADPRVMIPPGPHWPADWKQRWESGSSAYLAEWTGYEVQLLAGREQESRPLRQKNLAFYNITSQEHRPFAFRPGSAYTVELTVQGSLFSVSVDGTLISQMAAANSKGRRSRGHVGLQTYVNNGVNTKPFAFKFLAVEEMT